MADFVNISSLRITFGREGLMGSLVGNEFAVWGDLRLWGAEI